MLDFEHLLRSKFDIENEIYFQRYFKLCFGEYDQNQYTENHHVLPRWAFMEHTNTPENIVSIPPRIHMLAHYCLMIACPHYKNTLSYTFSTRQSPTRAKFVKLVPSRLLEAGRKLLSEQKKGCKGQIITEEGIKRIRESKIELYSAPEQRRIQSERVTGIPKSEEAKVNISKGAKKRFQDPEQRDLAAEKTRLFFAKMTPEERSEFYRKNKKPELSRAQRLINCSEAFYSPFGIFKSLSPKTLALTKSENNILNCCHKADVKISDFSKNALIYKIFKDTIFFHKTPRELGFYSIPIEEYVQSHEDLNVVRPLSPNHVLLSILSDFLSRYGVHLEIPTHSNQSIATA